MKWNSKSLLPTFFAAICLNTFAGEQATIKGPWFTGPLLASSGATIPSGHVNIEPYMFYTDDFGHYNNKWKATNTPNASIVSPTLILSAGVNKWMDVQAVVPYDFKSNQGQSDNNVGDISLTVGFQVLHQNPKTAMPNLRVSIEETFPSGRYQNLSPVRSNVEATGAGLYQTSIATNFQKLLKFENGKYLSMRLSFTYTFSPNTTVSGFNAFGGGFGTRGTINAGGIFNVDLGLEYTLTQHWVPALDIAASITGATKFTGVAGTNGGNPATTGAPSSDTISLAPAIEYNFSSKVGVIFGTWFSVSGRNTPEFVAAVGALNIFL